MLGHATLRPGATTTVFAGTEPSVTGDLAAIVKPAPVADLPVDNDRGHFAQAARCLALRRALQFERQLVDLLLQREHNRLAVTQQLFDPLRTAKVAKTRRFHHSCTGSIP